MDAGVIFEGLNPQQRAAVEATRGPLCILAGAGSGKTTTITRRIANQVATGAFERRGILAVTFTDKAAGEMRVRLAHLGAEDVSARTFHSAAYSQLRGLAAQEPGRVLPSKVLALRGIANTLPKPYRFRPAADLANEVEWAKNRRLDPAAYISGLGTHVPPIPPDLMQRVFASYEAGKRARDMVDFEDLLELAIRMFEQDEFALERFQERYRSLTVDEYQDVNLLQQNLLERWLGERDDLCVVGDDYQSIYGFTGATPDYLLQMPARYPRTTVVRLETNYRSTPQVLEAANRLAAQLAGAEKVLSAASPDGPRPEFTPHVTASDESRALVSAIRDLNERLEVPFEQMAILYRVNFRSEDFEEALSAARVPYQVRSGSFLTRAAARSLVARLRPGRAVEIAALTRAAAEREGLTSEAVDGLGEQEATRQADLARLVSLAEEFDDGQRTVADFIADLQVRFSGEGDGRGVNLLTYHRAKGLEFEAVFLPRLMEGELPFKRAVGDDAVDEERRLLYVGLTRARRHLFLSWVTGEGGRPSRFLVELGVAAHGMQKRPPAKADASPAFEALKGWRARRARLDEVPAFIVCHDTTLQAILAAAPSNLAELAAVDGIGPTKIERYGSEILEVLERLPQP